MPHPYPHPRRPAEQAADASPPRPLTTARLCAQADATRGMLRLYETEGLLAAPARSAAGYRHYPAAAVQRVRAIRLLKELAFSLKDIALLLDERDDHGLPPDRLRELAQAQLAQIDARMARLALVRSYFAAVATGDNTPLDADGECRFLFDFMAAAPVPAPAPRAAVRTQEASSW